MAMSSSSSIIVYRQSHHKYPSPTAIACPPSTSSISEASSHLYSFVIINMNWHDWLSKSGLHPSLARDYARLFSENQLEEDDVKYLDHELLLSMGISIGKHRLEILKLARKETKGLGSAVKRFRKQTLDYVRMLARSSSSAIVAVPKAAGGQIYASTITSSRKLLTATKEKLMITNGSPSLYDGRPEGGGAKVAVRWDTMFRDLKPT